MSAAAVLIGALRFKYRNELRQDKTNKVAYRLSKDRDQSEHLPRLIRVFTLITDEGSLHRVQN